jgi:glycosyltransferase involved in cell wall biosynthesis
VTTVRIRYAGALSATDWAARHAAGDVPDALPYGLDRLGEHGFRPEALEPPGREGVLARAARRVLGEYDWSRGKAASGEIALCWDERLGVPAALRGGGPVASGVIWLTEPARGVRRGDALARRALRRAELIWTLSTAQLEVLDRWGVEDPRWLRFGVDAGFWAPGGSSREGRVLSVGNDRNRDHVTLVAGVQQVASPSRRVDLLLASRRPASVPAALGTQVEALRHAALRSEYHRAQVVAIATKPNLHCSGITAVLEAMACARPVVASATPGMGDYVRDGIDGLLVPPGDPRALAEAVAGLLDAPDLCEQMGRAGRARVEELHSTERMAEQLATLLRPLAPISA